MTKVNNKRLIKKNIRKIRRKKTKKRIVSDKNEISSRPKVFYEKGVIKNVKK